MQIHNFYTDPVPAVRNPLDSIVLSPHTINASNFGLADFEKDSNDYRSVLPSISSCEYHHQDTCSKSKLILCGVQDIFHRLFKGREIRSDK
jgi:hypothetical protein